MIKNTHIPFFLFLLTTFVLSSCVEEFVIEDETFESKLVVNALFDSESPWSVEVSNSADIFKAGSKNEAITFATVEIFDQNNDFLYELYHQGEGVYGRDDFSPSPKRGYSIKVSAPGYRTVTGKSFVPEKSTLVINSFSIFENKEREDLEVDFSIEDRSKLESYYIWEIVSLTSGEDGDTSTTSSQLSDTWINDLTNNPNDLINSDRKFLENGSFGDGTYQGSYSSTEGNRGVNVFSGWNTAAGFSTNKIGKMAHVDPDINVPDVIANHNTKNIGNGSDDENEGEAERKVYKYELRVMTISKELYNYYSSLEEYYQNGGSNHSNQWPFELYTNIKNGAGIFAGFSESVIQF